MSNLGNASTKKDARKLRRKLFYNEPLMLFFCEGILADFHLDLFLHCPYLLIRIKMLPVNSIKMIRNCDKTQQTFRFFPD